jgi:hypothetical protein
MRNSYKIRGLNHERKRPLGRSRVGKGKVIPVQALEALRVA